LFTALTIDVVPVRGQYTATIDGAQTTLFAAWPIRPEFLLGVVVGDVGP
jgi:hypothetical protein